MSKTAGWLGGLFLSVCNLNRLRMEKQEAVASCTNKMSRPFAWFLELNQFSDQKLLSKGLVKST
jgi:hypothetical protein